jgi:hypothetical protein
VLLLTLETKVSILDQMLVLKFETSRTYCKPWNNTRCIIPSGSADRTPSKSAEQRALLPAQGSEHRWKRERNPSPFVHSLLFGNGDHHWPSHNS